MNKKILIALIVTSILTLIIGIVLTILNILNKNIENSNITEKENKEILLEDVRVYGYQKLDDGYKIGIKEKYEEEYKCTADNIELLCCTAEYDEVSINIYYIEDSDTKTIVRYELYNRETGKKIENVNNEEELREKLGYYLEGTYEEELTLFKIDYNPNFSMNSENSDMSYIYTFKNKNGKNLEMRYNKYHSESNPSNFESYKEYKVKFDVKRGSSNYEYIITSIEEKTNGEEQEEQQYDAETYANVADSWVGTYTNGSITVKLIRKGPTRLDYIIKNNMFTVQGILDTASENKLTYKGESFGELDSIKFERIQNGVKLTAVSTDSESVLNKCNGEYTLKKFTKSNWDGIYKNGDKSIIISEINKNELYITMNTAQTYNYEIALGGSKLNYSETEINYERKIADTEKLKITKTADGIKVVSSSTKSKDLLNSMSGTYYKQ